MNKDVAKIKKKGINLSSLYVYVCAHTIYIVASMKYLQQNLLGFLFIY